MMYCGTNKTALQSQKQTSEAMIFLLREKPFAQITVSELCRLAGISRQTFYSLFSGREDVMVFTLQAQYCEDLSPDVPDEPAGRDETLRWLCRSYSTYILRHKALIRLLVENRIDYLLYDSLFDALMRCDCLLEGVDPCTRRYAAGFLAGGVTSVARCYAQEGCTSSGSRLESLLETLLSGRLFRGAV